MNYYEELGIQQDASVEDIRWAYRALARLLPPDGQLDSDLKQLAERQMRRVSGLVKILIDPVKQRHYDDILMLGDGLRITRGNRTISVPTPAEG